MIKCHDVPGLDDILGRLCCCVILDSHDKTNLRALADSPLVVGALCGRSVVPPLPSPRPMATPRFAFFLALIIMCTFQIKRSHKLSRVEPALNSGHTREVV